MTDDRREDRPRSGASGRRRGDAEVPSPVASAPIVYYDGDCGLCQRSVRWLIRRDPRGVLRYAPLQGETARRNLPPLPEDAGEWALHYQDERGLHRGSGAVLRAIRRLGGKWTTLATLGLLVPRPLRDAVYGIIARARHRYPVACELPAPEERGRFLP